jgi:Flp pilus assembly protein TadG
MLKKAETGILRHAEGSTIVEYAIIAPVLMLLILGIVEYNMVMYGMAVLDGAITIAAREGHTGYVNSTSSGTCPSPVVNGTLTPQTQAQYINCLIGVHVGGLFDTSKLQISYVDTGSSAFNAASDTPTFPSGPCTNNPALANPPTFPMCTESSQTAGDIVVYTVTYPWPIYTPIVQSFLGSHGTFTLSASAVVKNEPYSIGVSR